MQKQQKQKAPPRNDPDSLRIVHPDIGPGKSFIEDPEVDSDSRVLVLAPHLEDPIIGCGGTMCKLAKRGAHVKVLYMTDSSYESDVGVTGRPVPMSPKEAEDSLARLRCFSSEHMGLTNLAMHCDDASKRRLLEAIEYYSPDLIFIPWLQDTHPDNMVTGLLAAHALKEYDARPIIYSYKVWGDLSPNTMVEITEEMDDKVTAINVRRYQARQEHGEQMLREANVFRLCSMQKDRYCESFLRQGKEEFVAIAWQLGIYNEQTGDCLTTPAHRGTMSMI